MLKSSLYAVCAAAVLGGCGSARTEPSPQPSFVYYTTSTTAPGNAVLVYGTETVTTKRAACGQGGGDTGQPVGPPEIVYETPETLQALVASGITVTPNGIAGRNFRLEAMDCYGVRTEKFLLRGSRAGTGPWHVRIISANSDCSSDLAVALDGSLAHYLPSPAALRCRPAGR
jgi:hypothetical protein